MGKRLRRRLLRRRLLRRRLRRRRRSSWRLDRPDARGGNAHHVWQCFRRRVPGAAAHGFHFTHLSLKRVLPLRAHALQSVLELRTAVAQRVHFGERRSVRELQRRVLAVQAVVIIQQPRRVGCRERGDCGRRSGPRAHEEAVALAQTGTHDSGRTSGCDARQRLAAPRSEGTCGRSLVGRLHGRSRERCSRGARPLRCRYALAFSSCTYDKCEPHRPARAQSRH